MAAIGLTVAIVGGAIGSRPTRDATTKPGALAVSVVARRWHGYGQLQGPARKVAAQRAVPGDVGVGQAQRVEVVLVVAQGPGHSLNMVLGRVLEQVGQPGRIAVGGEDSARRAGVLCRPQGDRGRGLEVAGLAPVAELR